MAPNIQEGDMLNISTGPSFMQERLLMQEITHRVNNEFASAIGMVSLAAARSDNAEVKVCAERNYGPSAQLRGGPSRSANAGAA